MILTKTDTRELNVTLDEDGSLLIAERVKIFRPGRPGGHGRWDTQKVAISPEEWRKLQWFCEKHKVIE